MHLIKSRFVNKLLFIFFYYYIILLLLKSSLELTAYGSVISEHSEVTCHFNTATLQQPTLLTRAVFLASSPGHRATAEKDRPHGHPSAPAGYEDWPRKIPAGLLSQTPGWCARLRAHQQQVSPLHDTVMRRWPFSVGHVALQC